MAHRKPLGTTCRTTADWRGDTPFLHDALVTSAGTWYRIVGMEETASQLAALNLPVEQRRFKLKLVLERVAEPEVFTDGSVRWPDACVGMAHEFEWYERKRKAA